MRRRIIRSERVFDMKKILQGSVVIAAILAVGWLFGLLSGLRYSVQGTSGTLEVIGVIMSTLYLLVFLGVFTWFGYKKTIACFVAGGVMFALVGIMGTMGYMGLGFLLGRSAEIYFLLTNPFAPLIESIAVSGHIYYMADRVLLIVPLIVYFLTMVFYVLGTVLRAHERALYYSLMRLDSRYEYRLPLEEAEKVRAPEKHSA